MFFNVQAGQHGVVDLMALLKLDMRSHEIAWCKARTLWFSLVNDSPKASLAELTRTLQEVRKYAHILGWDSLVRQTERMINEATEGLPPEATVNDWQEAITHELEYRFNREYFAYVPADHADWLKDDPAPWGDHTATAFLSLPADIHFEIGEARKCFALDRFTACVFHLMRIVEAILPLFAARVGVAQLQRADMGVWLKKIEEKVKGMESAPEWLSRPDFKEKREEFQSVVATFQSFKDAWRNPIAHARSKYTQEEAKRVYNGVEHFTRELAKQLLLDASVGS